MHTVRSEFAAALSAATLLVGAIDSAGATQAQTGGEEELDNVNEIIGEHLATCGPRYERLIERIEKADVGHSEYYPVPDYPWVRTDRFLASYIGEFESKVQMATWLAQLRDNEGYSRRIELRNLGMPAQERAQMISDLRVCAVWLSTAAAFDPEKREDFFKAASLPERGDPRAAAPPANERIGRAEDAAGAPQAVEVDLDSDALKKTVEWRVRRERSKSASEVLALFGDLPRDVLGRVGMIKRSWKALAAHYAPAWLIDAGGDADRPGTVRWGEQGPYVDRESPAVYWQITFARVDDRPLPQLNYFLWFGGSEDEAAPSVSNGLIWRVTLNHAGYPIAYESLRMNSTGHRWFPVADLPVNAQADPRLPQGRVGVGPVTVRVSGGGHQVLHVDTDRKHAVDMKRIFELRPYEDLYSLPTPDGETASLFGPEGFVVGTRTEAGGGMRQLKRHSLAPREPWFFDNPKLMAHVFKRSAVIDATDAGPP